MPWAAQKPCSNAGCSVLVNRKDRYCTAHQRASWRDRTAARRADPIQRERLSLYSSPRWRSLRRWFLGAHPLCAQCQVEGQISAANVVDHIKAIADGGDAWDVANLQPLCARHHDAKSARETVARSKG